MKLKRIEALGGETSTQISISFETHFFLWKQSSKKPSVGGKVCLSCEEKKNNFFIAKVMKEEQ